MPNVGGKKFPYTATGQAQARRYARESGQPMSRSRNAGRNRACLLYTSDAADE